MSQKTFGPADMPALDEQVQLSSAMLLGKTALVTGSSRGIGASVARQFAQLGVDIAINYRSKGPRAQEVADELAAMGEMRSFSG